MDPFSESTPTKMHGHATSDYTRLILPVEIPLQKGSRVLYCVSFKDAELSNIGTQWLHKGFATASQPWWMGHVLEPRCPY